MILNIKNFVQITNLIGTAGQPKSNEFTDIKANGYEAVINLAMPDHKESIDNEGKIVTLLGMTYIHLPVPFEAPTKSHVREFFTYMDSLQEKKVFVHCIMNYRVSAFMFHYLTKVRKFKPNDAMSPIFDHWQPDMVWSDLLKWSSESIYLQKH